MFHVARRSVVIGAAAAAAAFGIGKRLELLPAASAQGGSLSPMNPKGLQFHRFSLGDIEVTQILDGATERAHDPGFIRNASVEDTKAALRAAGLPDENVPICPSTRIPSSPRRPGGPSSTASRPTRSPSPAIIGVCLGPAPWRRTGPATRLFPWPPEAWAKISGASYRASRRLNPVQNRPPTSHAETEIESAACPRRLPALVWQLASFATCG